MDKYKSSKKKWADNNKDYQKKWFKAVSERNPDWNRASHLKARYGLTILRYDEMVKEQNGLCKICKRLPSGKRVKLVIDHCHKTNKVRGLLCHPCNVLIGMAEENIETLQESILYLKSSLPEDT